MANRKTYDGQLRNVFDQLADSVLLTTDSDISTEIRDSGGSPQERAGHTRAVLAKAVALFDAVNRRLWALGHTFNPKQWRRGENREHHIRCETCGQAVSFTISTGEIYGDALLEACPKHDGDEIAHTASI